MFSRKEVFAAILLSISLALVLFSTSVKGHTNFHENGFIVLEYTDKDILAFELEQFAEGHIVKEIQYDTYIEKDIVHYTALVHYKDIDQEEGG